MAEKTKKAAKLDKPQEQLVLEFRGLKNKYEQFLGQNKLNVERIALLNKKVSNFENEAKRKPKTVPLDKVSVETQTTLVCKFCAYPCKDLIDLGEHQYQCYGPEEEKEQEAIVCYICGWKSDSKGDLMKHRIENHVQRLRICQYYVKGVCEFEPEVCWYTNRNRIKIQFMLENFEL